MDGGGTLDIHALTTALTEAWKQLADEKALAERRRLSLNEYHKVLKWTLERLDETKEQLTTARTALEPFASLAQRSEWAGASSENIVFVRLGDCNDALAATDAIDKEQ